MSRQNDIAIIREALLSAAEAIRPFTPGAVDYDEKSSRGDPVTAADLAANEVLLEILPQAGEGWLSEETADSPDRLQHDRVWVVDPLDGTREFVDGIPEWCISIGLVESGVPVAGGILSPTTDQLILGSVETGVSLNGERVQTRLRTDLDGARILASRSEWKRGEWDVFADSPFMVEPCGSVAFKLGQVAAGLADGTWTLVPKNEWDVAGGAALVLAAGGTLLHADGTKRRFNQANPLMPNFLAAHEDMLREFRENWLP